MRKPDGEIAQVAREIDPLAVRHWALRLPIVRGVVALGESLSIGFRALSVSANYAAPDGGARRRGRAEELSRWALVFSFAVAIGFALMLFKVGPALLADLLPISSGGWFVIVEGLIRVSVFVLYLALLSLIPSLRRVFQYHAAEHKVINAYEAGEELTPETVQRFSLIHPRCGTAFLLWVMVIGVFVFAFFGRPVWYWLIISARPAVARHRRDRIRADPVRRQARREPCPDDAARAGALVAAADDARAEPRPARGVDSGAPRGAGSRGSAGAGRPTGGGDGVVATVRRADVKWIGGLKDGAGKIVSTTTGALPELEVTWNARVNEDQTITSPEELLAAAHASCYAMQFSSGLVRAGREPEEVTVSAEVSFEVGVGITTSALTVRVAVDGLTDDEIREIAAQARYCPVSRALAGVDITLRPARPGASSRGGRRTIILDRSLRFSARP